MMKKIFALFLVIAVFSAIASFTSCENGTSTPTLQTQPAEPAAPTETPAQTVPENAPQYNGGPVQAIAFGGASFLKTEEVEVLSQSKIVYGVDGDPGRVFTKDKKYKLRPFIMSKYEVTRELYEAVMNSNVSAQSSISPSISETDPLGEVKKFKPAVNMSFCDAAEFCNRLTELTMGAQYKCYAFNTHNDTDGYIVSTHSKEVYLDITQPGYRLPTGAEWEYAARGGSIIAKDWNFKYSGAASEKELDGAAWYKKNSLGAVHEVGKKKPNALGIFDMSGNVNEYCNDSGEMAADIRGWNSASKTPEENGVLTDPILPLINASTPNATRGGGYISESCDIFDWGTDETDYDIGIRLVRSTHTPPHPIYTVTIESGIKNGTIEVSKKNYRPNEELWFTITADDGYQLDILTVTTEDGKPYAHYDWRGGPKWPLKMPSDQSVTITATFIPTYRELGTWPQKLKDDSVTVTEYEKKTVGIFTYYQGSDQNWYVKKDGKYYKVEPIKWRVLSARCDGKTLLLADSTLMDLEYHKQDSGNNNNYKDSEIRAWLNGDFFNTAFTDKEKKTIATTTVDNSERSTNMDGGKECWWNNGKNPYACENTDDKVFLLSAQEVTREAYGFNVYVKDEIQLIKATDFSATIYEGKMLYPNYWWLRSPVYDNKDHVYVIKLDSGEFLDRNLASYNTSGVVPALRVDN